jgi:hypothetical protein
VSILAGNYEYSYIMDTSRQTPDPSGSTAPYRPSWWNSDNDSDGECGAITKARFVMPAASSTENPPFW